MIKWDRKLWGVMFTASRTDDDEPMLLGEAWDTGAIVSRPDAPTRTLLFRTNREAMAWCQRNNSQWKSRTDSLNKWRVRPVRVRELVEQLI